MLYSTASAAPKRPPPVPRRAQEEPLSPVSSGGSLSPTSSRPSSPPSSPPESPFGSAPRIVRRPGRLDTQPSKSKIMMRRRSCIEPTDHLGIAELEQDPCREDLATSPVPAVPPSPRSPRSPQSPGSG